MRLTRRSLFPDDATEDEIKTKLASMGAGLKSKYGAYAAADNLSGASKRGATGENQLVNQVGVVTAQNVLGGLSTIGLTTTFFPSLPLSSATTPPITPVHIKLRIEHGYELLWDNSDWNARNVV